METLRLIAAIICLTVACCALYKAVQQFFK